MAETLPMEPLKSLYSPAYINLLADALTTHAPGFNRNLFMARVMDSEWASRALKSRMHHITLVVAEFLPNTFADAIKILFKIRPLMEGLKYIEFANIWFSDFVEYYGIESPDRSFQALEYFTQNSSAEFAIRPFIIKYPEKAMVQMLIWARHPHEHVRRLASEGCRPRLPWGMALERFKKDPAPIILVLEQLKNDASEYVRRSVANNLNDISKDHPEIVLRIAKSWQGINPETDWILKHGCRTLLKKANVKSLSHFGLTKPKGLTSNKLNITPKTVRIGDSIRFTTTLHIRSAQKLRIEFVVTYVKSGEQLSDKVFQISEKNFSPGKIVISKKLSLKNLTTRKHYPGTHSIAIRINGTVVVQGKFLLKNT